MKNQLGNRRVRKTYSISKLTRFPTSAGNDPLNKLVSKLLKSYDDFRIFQVVMYSQSEKSESKGTYNLTSEVIFPMYSGTCPDNRLLEIALENFKFMRSPKSKVKF